MVTAKRFCPFDPTQVVGEPCKYGDRCPYHLRRGKKVVCLGTVPTDLHAAYMVASHVPRGEAP